MTRSSSPGNKMQRHTSQNRLNQLGTCQTSGRVHPRGNQSANISPSSTPDVDRRNKRDGGIFSKWIVLLPGCVHDIWTKMWRRLVECCAPVWRNRHHLVLQIYLQTSRRKRSSEKRGDSVSDIIVEEWRWRAVARCVGWFKFLYSREFPSILIYSSFVPSENGSMGAWEARGAMHLAGIFVSCLRSSISVLKSSSVLSSWSAFKSLNVFKYLLSSRLTLVDLGHKKKDL